LLFDKMAIDLEEAACELCQPSVEIQASQFVHLFEKKRCPFQQVVVEKARACPEKLQRLFRPLGFSGRRTAVFVTAVHIHSGTKHHRLNRG